MFTLLALSNEHVFVLLIASLIIFLILSVVNKMKKKKKIVQPSIYLDDEYIGDAYIDATKGISLEANNEEIVHKNLNSMIIGETEFVKRLSSLFKEIDFNYNKTRPNFIVENLFFNSDDFEEIVEIFSTPPFVLNKKETLEYHFKDVFLTLNEENANIEQKGMKHIFGNYPSKYSGSALNGTIEKIIKKKNDEEEYLSKYKFLVYFDAGISIIKEDAVQGELKFSIHSFVIKKL